jgi:hypothetical protein
VVGLAASDVVELNAVACGYSSVKHPAEQPPYTDGIEQQESCGEQEKEGAR